MVQSIMNQMMSVHLVFAQLNKRNKMENNKEELSVVDVLQQELNELTASPEVREQAIEERFQSEEAKADLDYINRVIQDNLGSPLVEMLKMVQLDSLQDSQVKSTLIADIALLDKLNANEGIGDLLQTIVDIPVDAWGLEANSDFIRNNFLDMLMRVNTILGFIRKKQEA
jgi:hypothetical protein